MLQNVSMLLTSMLQKTACLHKQRAIGCTHISYCYGDWIKLCLLSNVLTNFAAPAANFTFPRVHSVPVRGVGSRVRGVGSRFQNVVPRIIFGVLVETTALVFSTRQQSDVCFPPSSSGTGACKLREYCDAHGQLKKQRNSLINSHVSLLHLLSVVIVICFRK